MDRYPILQFFRTDHLPAELQEVAGPFRIVAERVAETLPMGAETSTALRKLLEAKDCAVRAKVGK